MGIFHRCGMGISRYALGINVSICKRHACAVLLSCIRTFDMQTDVRVYCRTIMLGVMYLFSR